MIQKMVKSYEKKISQELWSHSEHYNVYSIDVYGDTVYSVGYYDKLIATDIDTGDVKQKNTDHQERIRQVVVDNAVIYTGGWSGEVIATELNGTKMWREDLNETDISDMDILDDRLFLGMSSYSGNVSAYEIVFN